jgi:hypothetical protein
VSSTVVQPSGSTVTQPSSSTSVPAGTGGGGVATHGPTTTTTTPAPGISDAQVTALEQTLSAIDVILANLDKSLAADATLAP